MINGLVLAGGNSSRMLEDKAMLERNGCPLYKNAINALLPITSQLYVSARKESGFLADLEFPVLFDEHDNIGPAAALLRAYKHDPEADWFVLACDFANASEEEVAWLFLQHRDTFDITCYAQHDGRPEPLFAIWTPNALVKLSNNVKTGFTGPMHTLRECEVQMRIPRKTSADTNTITRY